MTFRPFPRSLLALGVLGWSAAGAGAEAPELSLPIECVPQETCFIQVLVDTDPGSAAVDFSCGSSTYVGHTGTDVRVLSAAPTDAGIPVLAAADGSVIATRRDSLAVTP